MLWLVLHGFLPTLLLLAYCAASCMLYCWCFFFLPLLLLLMMMMMLMMTMMVQLADDCVLDKRYQLPVMPTAVP
jgi:hypothetical protein